MKDLQKNNLEAIFVVKGLQKKKPPVLEHTHNLIMEKNYYSDMGKLLIPCSEFL
jgi:hypothetical protein